MIFTLECKGRLLSAAALLVDIAEEELTAGKAADAVAVAVTLAAAATALTAAHSGSLE